LPLPVHGYACPAIARDAADGWAAQTMAMVHSDAMPLQGSNISESLGNGRPSATMHGQPAQPAAVWAPLSHGSSWKAVADRRENSICRPHCPERVGIQTCDVEAMHRRPMIFAPRQMSHAAMPRAGAVRCASRVAMSRHANRCIGHGGPGIVVSTDLRTFASRSTSGSSDVAWEFTER
jgi:hypothetical protein